MSIRSSGMRSQQFFHSSLLRFIYHSTTLFEQCYSHVVHITAQLSGASRQWQYPAQASLEGAHFPSIPLLVIPVYSDSNPSSALYKHKYIWRSGKYQPLGYLNMYTPHDTLPCFILCWEVNLPEERHSCYNNSLPAQDKNKAVVCDCCQLYLHLWHKCSYALWNKNPVSPETVG